MAKREDCAICKEEVTKEDAQTLPSGKKIHADHAKRS